MITETISHIILAVDLFHGAASALATLLAAVLAGVMALAFDIDGDGPTAALVAAVVASPAVSAPTQRIATAETIRRDEARFIEHFTVLARRLRSGAAEAHQLEDLRDMVPLMLGYARHRGASPEEIARLHARYWGTVGTVTRAVKRRR